MLLDRGTKRQSQPLEEASDRLQRGGRQLLVRDVMPARRVDAISDFEHLLVAGDVLPSADLLKRGGAELAPSRDQHEAPAGSAQRPEAIQALRKAVCDESGARPPPLHKRAHIVCRAPTEEDER